MDSTDYKFVYKTGFGQVELQFLSYLLGRLRLTDWMYLAAAVRFAKMSAACAISKQDSFIFLKHKKKTIGTKILTIAGKRF